MTESQVINIRKLKAEVDISNDDLREVMMIFMKKLKIRDLRYVMFMVEEEYNKRRYINERDSNATFYLCSKSN